MKASRGYRSASTYPLPPFHAAHCLRKLHHRHAVPGDGQKKMVRSAGVEPTTFGFGGRRSIQLSYERIGVACTRDGRERQAQRFDGRGDPARTPAWFEAHPAGFLQRRTGSPTRSDIPKATGHEIRCGRKLQSRAV